MIRRAAFCLAGWALAGAAAWAQLPDAPGRDTVKRVCASCHPAEVVLGKGMTREQWGTMVSNMISRGAKGTDAEFAEVVDYLSKNLPPGSPNALAPAKKKAKGGGGLLDQAGAADKQIVDDDAASRGKTIYIAQCVTCHGPKGRGTERGADMVRSLVVLKDRYGDKIGPFLAKGHPMQSGAPGSSLTQDQIVDLSHFLHEKVGDTLRTGPYNSVLNVLTGNAADGRAYFNGAGGCANCHSAAGDLAGVASKYDPPRLQLKMVFPQTIAFGARRSTGKGKQTAVTVRMPSGEMVEGELLEADDFSVSLLDSTGTYRSFSRALGVTVDIHDPYKAHEELLDRYTDRDIHNLVAYLETLK